jgi:biopolymer transport protein ExbD
MRIFEQPALRRVPAIRVINLVDILFILLIFFIATTTFRRDPVTAVKLALPEAKTAEELGRTKVARLLVTVAPDETIYVDNRPVHVASLEAILRKAREQNSDVQVQFSADKKVSYGMVVAIMDAARAAGIHDITAFTKRSVK